MKILGRNMADVGNSEEREKNRQRKLKAVQNREWDSTKTEEDYNPRGYNPRYRRGANGGVVPDQAPDANTSKRADAPDMNTSKWADPTPSETKGRGEGNLWEAPTEEATEEASGRFNAEGDRDLELQKNYEASGWGAPEDDIRGGRGGFDVEEEVDGVVVALMIGERVEEVDTGAEGEGMIMTVEIGDKLMRIEAIMAVRTGATEVVGGEGEVMKAAVVAMKAAVVAGVEEMARMTGHRETTSLSSRKRRNQRLLLRMSLLGLSSRVLRRSTYLWHHLVWDRGQSRFRQSSSLPHRRRRRRLRLL
jgi:hypothetical protein